MPNEGILTKKAMSQTREKYISELLFFGALHHQKSKYFIKNEPIIWQWNDSEWVKPRIVLCEVSAIRETEQGIVKKRDIIELSLFRTCTDA